MKEKLIIGLLGLAVFTMWLQYVHPAKKIDWRYEIVPTGNITVLIDKTTGETWRNSVCNDTSQVPGCWEKMGFVNQETILMPIGEQRLREKDIPKYVKTQQKLIKQQEKIEQKSLKPENAQ